MEPTMKFNELLKEFSNMMAEYNNMPKTETPELLKLEAINKKLRVCVDECYKEVDTWKRIWRDKCREEEALREKIKVVKYILDK